MFKSSKKVDSFEKSDTIFETFENELSKWYYQDDILEDFQKFKSKYHDIILLSKKYNFEEIPANGYHSFSLFCLKFFNQLNNQSYFKHIKSTKEIAILLKLLLFHQDVLINFEKAKHSSTDYNDNNKLTLDYHRSLFAFDFVSTAEPFKMYLETPIEQATIMRSFSGFWLTKRAQFLYQMYIYLNSFTYLDFPKCFKIFFSTKLRAKSFVHSLNNSTYQFPCSLWDLLDTNFARKLEKNILFNQKDAIGKNFSFKSPNQFKIAEKGIELEVRQDNDIPLVKCRVIKHRYIPNTNGVVVFHLHGSGFVATRPEFHECYLKKWVAKLNGVAILSVDYSLKTKFPVQFQEVLDAYIWLTSGSDEVEKIIGYLPQSIVICADSAGGLLAMSTLFALIQIEKQSSIQIMYPKYFVSFYSTFNVSGNFFSPSKFISYFDPILNYGVMFAIAGMISGLEGSVKIKKPNPSAASRFFKGFHHDFQKLGKALMPEKQEPWYKENGQFSWEQFNVLCKLLDSPYLNALAMNIYEKLSSIRLSLITSHFCPFLDDNIEMAKLWKGPLEVHILDEVPHGFLFLPCHQESREFGLKKLQEAIEYSALHA